MERLWQNKRLGKKDLVELVTYFGQKFNVCTQTLCLLYSGQPRHIVTFISGPLPSIDLSKLSREKIRSDSPVHHELLTERSELSRSRLYWVKAQICIESLAFFPSA